MKFRSIQLKIALWAGACLVAAAAVFISYSAYNTRRVAINSGQAEATAQARNQAGEVRSFLEAPMNVTRTISQSVKASKTGNRVPLTREEVNGMLRQVLEENTDFLAIYSDWEPNIFDGKDAQYANKPGYNSTGRFNTTFSRNDEGKIDMAFTREGEEETQDWYQLPKKNMGDTILDPYFYPVQGKDTLETSLISPIIVDGRFYGLIGIDMRIDALQKRADQLDLYDRTGRLLLVSNNGVIAAATGQPAAVNQPLRTAFPQLAPYQRNIQKGLSVAGFVGDDLLVIEPLTIGGTRTPWATMLLVPRSKITSAAFQQLGTQVLLGVVMVLAALVMLWFLARRLAAPIRQAATAADQLSYGILPDAIPVNSNDETGQLAQSMNEMTKYLREMADTSDRIALGDLEVNVQPRSDQDRFGYSFQRMTNYLQDMARVSDEIGGGNLNVKVEPKSEFDRFGHSFQTMLERTLRLVQSDEDRAEIQESIMKLLKEVSDVASGDLTAQAEVSSDMTGAIADAFNMMISDLREIIYKVKDASYQVNKSAIRIQLATDELASGTQFQAAQINQTSEAVKTMAVSIQQVSQNAAQSAQVANQSLYSSRKGAEAVQNNIAAMGRIREQVQETAKRIKRLGERSQEIGTSIQFIQDIADRTSMLALNASIQAANAGAAGRGFVVVAEEIEHLAERTAEVTKQIETLIQNIQSETSEVVAAMEDTTSTVVHGSSLAAETSTALQEIESVSHNLAALIQSISQASQQQANGSESIAQAMSQISRVTHQIELGTNQVAASARQMVAQSEDLSGSVVTFKLPVAPDQLRSTLPFQMEVTHI